MHARTHARMLTPAPMNNQKTNNRQRSTHRQAVLMSQLFYVRAATHSNGATATSAVPRDGTYSEQSGSALRTGASIAIAFGAFVLGMVVMAVVLLGILRLVNESKRIQNSLNLKTLF